MSTVLGKKIRLVVVGFTTRYSKSDNDEEKRKHGVALADTFAFVCSLALSPSGRDERAAVCTNLLCAGAIACCSAVLAVHI